MGHLGEWPPGSAIVYCNAVVTSEIKLKQNCFISVLIQM